MRIVAVVLGGGTGQRIGAALPKQLLKLGGRTLLEHCVAAFEQAPGIDEILVVMAGDYVEQVRAMLAGGGYGKVTGVIAGGTARPDSTRAALAVHEAAGVAVPASDTIVITDNGMMHSMPRRETLWRCQTPQCFRLPVIARAHELAAADPDFAPTDDCGVVLRYLPGVDVHIVPGSERNLKITYPQDLAVAEALLAE